MKSLEKNWKWVTGAAVVLAIYFWATRQRIVGVVDANGDDMTVNGA